MDFGVRGDRLYGSNMPLKGWIQIAYQVKDFQVAGPEWISSENFDIDARAEALGQKMNPDGRVLTAGGPRNSLLDDFWETLSR
jgi:uncharacterized protein (TIGR03435 family)